MNGQHITGTPIVVDYWRLNNVPPRSLFFLTHMHADHTSGLSPRWPHNIHCTPVTAKLLIRKFKIEPKLVVELEVGESKILRVDTPNDPTPVNITVTTLDANHCPGSAMFLFEGYFGRILYTGDFRFCPSMLENPLLNGSRSINVLYLDNTYCDPQCNFPTRTEAAQEVMSLIETYHDKLIIIGFHTLGKEDLLVSIANKFQTYIGVSEEQYKTLEILEMPNVFTCNMEDTRIHVYPFHMVSKDLLTEMKSDALAILPTCLYTGQSALEPPHQEYIKVVPYSDHSSFSELRQFVKSVRPRCVRPIVRSFSGERNSVGLLRGNMSVFDDLLDPSPVPDIQVPSGILKLLSTKSSESSLASSLHTPTPHSGLKSIPKLKRSGSYSMSHRNRPKGVQYISPVKLNYHIVTNSDSEHNGAEAAADENPDCHSEEEADENPDFHSETEADENPDCRLESPCDTRDLNQPLNYDVTTDSTINPRVSKAHKMVSISLETDSTCQRTCGFSLSTERVTHSRNDIDATNNMKTSFTCARARLIDMTQLRRYRESEEVDVTIISPKKHKETVVESIESSLLTELQSHSKLQSPSDSSIPCQNEKEDKDSLLRTSQTACENTVELLHVTPLPKLASPSALEYLYGVEPSRREIQKANSKRLNHSTSSELLSCDVNRKHSLEEERMESRTKRSRVLPPDIYFRYVANGTEENNSQEKTNSCLLAQLEETGLLQKLKKVDLSTPAVTKIMHSALNAAQNLPSSNSDSLTLPSTSPSLDSIPREEGRLQGFTNHGHPPLDCDQCSGDKICKSGLDSFINQDKANDTFLEWLVTYDPF